MLKALPILVALSWLQLCGVLLGLFSLTFSTLFNYATSQFLKISMDATLIIF